MCGVRVGPARWRPTLPVPPDARRSDDVVARRLASIVAAIEDATRGVRAGRPERVHDLRVAIRRGRACLRTFRPLFERDRAERLRGELESMTTMLGSARDPEVLARRLARRLDRVDVEERMGPVRRELVGDCRAAAETVRPLAPAGARRLGRRFEVLQDVLGERQDAPVARRLLVHEGARVGVQAAHNGFTYGLLAEQERAAVRAMERR